MSEGNSHNEELKDHFFKLIDMKTKEKILGDLWEKHNTETDKITVLDSDFVYNVIYEAMEEYATQEQP